MRVRFAPSPTGPLTLGNARTALFNWVFARKNGGKFLLRIEDTDKERSKPEFEENIMGGLKWLGLSWDEQIVRQSERTDLYRKKIEELLEKGAAYYCFCSKEDLEKERQAKLSQGLPPKYSGACRRIGTAEAESRIAAGERAVIRFKMPEKEISFNDLVRGKITFDGSLIGDFVIAKNLESPLYNFAVVIDDYLMEITHVIRGEDHIANTPKQIAIMETFGFPVPTYAHLPLILGPGGKKLSKRFSAQAVLDYKKEGYLKEAVINFLLLLGWHPEIDKEIVTLEEAVNTFDMKKIQKSGAVFNQEKLDWLNAYYLKNLPTDALYQALFDFIPPQWSNAWKEEKIKAIIEVERERLKKLSDFPKLAKFFFEFDPNYNPDLIYWDDKKKESQSYLETVYQKLSELPAEKFTKENIALILEKLSEKTGSRGVVYWPLRAALTGEKASPGGIEVAIILGKRETLRRIKLALIKLTGK